MGATQAAGGAAMTPHLAPALRQAAAECRRDPDLMAAAALRIDSDARLIGRLVADFARQARVTEAELMARYPPGEPATSADSGPGAETGEGMRA